MSVEMATVTTNAGSTPRDGSLQMQDMWIVSIGLYISVTKRHSGSSSTVVL